MSDFEHGARPTRSDVVNAYRIALGRDPETAKVVDDRLPHDNADWFPGFFTSSEFRENVYDKILRSGSLGGRWFDAPPEPALREWAAHFIPLTGEGRERVRTATDWYGMLRSLFSDEHFRRYVLRDQAGEVSPSFIEKLGALSDLALRTEIKGEIEVFTTSEVRGWAVDVRNIDHVLELELFVDGQFAGAGSTSIFRRDLQDRFGSAGNSGFVIRYAADTRSERARVGEVREAASGTSLGTFRLPQRQSPPLDAVAQVRRELRELRAVLDRIEARLPAFHVQMGFSLDTYDDYFRAYYMPVDARIASGQCLIDLAVIVDGTGLATLSIDTAIASIARQSHRPRELVVLFDGGDMRIAGEALLDRWRAAVGADVSITGLAVDPGGRAEALNRAVERCSGFHLLFFSARSVLAPGAAGAFFDAMEAGAAIVYADEDEIALVGAGDEHLNPKFRTAFDYDLLLQQDHLGELIGVPRERAGQVRFRSEYPGAEFHDLALRLSEIVDHARFVHLPRIFLHRHEPAAESEDQPFLAAVRDHLSRVDPAASAEPHIDILGATVPSAVRVRRAVVPARKAAIIIPTRDRLDLLGPCVASVAASAVRNQVEIEILVIDNQSAAATTSAFLDTFSRHANFRVVEHDGAFNWALMNNRAAEQTDADILVFLNNDTVVLSEDCWDELCANAARPEVGAVGARLLYEDGTIQHAGMVMDQWHSFATHEGVRAAGSDRGYLDRHALLRQVSTVTGACLATRADLFRRVGGFDALNFPVEGNDTDYCLRLRSEGLKILYDPYATLYHFESVSRGFNTDEAKRRQAFLTTQTLRERWADKFADDPFYNPHFDRLNRPFTRLQPPPLLDRVGARSG